MLQYSTRDEACTHTIICKKLQAIRLTKHDARDSRGVFIVVVVTLTSIENVVVVGFSVFLQAQRACVSHVHSLRCLPNECQTICCCDSNSLRSQRERELRAQLRVEANDSSRVECEHTSRARTVYSWECGWESAAHSIKRVWVCESNEHTHAHSHGRGRKQVR